ncbi:MAG: MBL fold metallo-hydrolase [Ruminococcus sp.]|nr:MBL fold metallo-hydrolase [Ruminococcus sp.]
MERKKRRRSPSESNISGRKGSQALSKIINILLIFLVGLAFRYYIAPNHPPVATGEVRVYMLDVGQGDACLIRTETMNVLIDGGEREQGDHLVRMLHALQVKKLDYVINSHPHYDHFGGLISVFEEIPVGKLVMCDFPESLTPTSAYFETFLDVVEASGAAVSIPQCGDTLVLDDAVLTFLSVDNSNYTDLNDCSLLCRLDHQSVSFLFCGDLTAKGERDFVEQGLIAPADVLKCAHHGSNSSTCAAFLAAVQPVCVGISAGLHNDYGHPSVKCLQRISQYTDEVYRTDLDGDVLFSSDGSTLKVTVHYQADEVGKEAW